MTSMSSVQRIIIEFVLPERKVIYMMAIVRMLEHVTEERLCFPLKWCWCWWVLAVHCANDTVSGFGKN